MESKGYPSLWRMTAPLLILPFAGVFSQPSEVDTSTQSSYPLCPGALSFIGDGGCDDNNNNAECGWDEGDCGDCTCEGSSDYACGPYFDCQDPDAGCHTETAAPTSSPTGTCAGTSDFIADGDCDGNNNNAACDYDGGDCCECTCEDGQLYTCGPSFDNCDDPLSNCHSPIVTPSPTSGRSPIDSDDEPTSVSTSRGISTAVLASACVAGVLVIGVIAFCGRRKHLERKRGGARGSDRTPAANRPHPTAPSQTSGQGTSAGVEHDGQLNAIVGPFPVSEDQPANTNPAAIMWLPFRDAAEEEGVEATNPEGSPTNFPVAVSEPPSYTQAMESVG